MDKRDKIYDLYLSKGIITEATSREKFKSASPETVSKLYDLGSKKGLFQTTDLETFSSAWQGETTPTETIAPTGQESFKPAYPDLKKKEDGKPLATFDKSSPNVQRQILQDSGTDAPEEVIAQPNPNVFVPEQQEPIVAENTQVAPQFATPEQQDQVLEREIAQEVKDFKMPEKEITLKQRIQGAYDAVADPKQKGYFSRKYESGVNSIAAGLYRTPEFIYDIAVGGYNLLLQGQDNLLGTNSGQLPTSEELGKKTGITNYPAKLLEERNKALQSVKTKYDGSISDFISNGEYSKAAMATAGSITESLPFTLALMVPGMQGASVRNTFLGTTGVMGANRKQELLGNQEEIEQQIKQIESDPRISREEKTLRINELKNTMYSETQMNVNSLAYGAAEAVEVLLGVAGSYGRTVRSVAEKEGMGKARQFTSAVFDKVLKDNPYLAPFTEGLQEGMTTYLQNLSDIVILKEDKDVMEGVKDAIIVGGVMGAGFKSVEKGMEYAGKKIEQRQVKEDIGIIKTLSTNGKILQGVMADIDSKVDNMELTKQEANEQKMRVTNTVAAYNAIPDNFSETQKAEALPLVEEKIELESKIEGKDPALVKAEKTRLEEINLQLENISTKKAETNTEPTAVAEQEIVSESETNKIEATEETVLDETTAEEAQIDLPSFQDKMAEKVKEIESKTTEKPVTPKERRKKNVKSAVEKLSKQFKKEKIAAEKAAVIPEKMTKSQFMDKAKVVIKGKVQQIKVGDEIIHQQAVGQDNGMDNAWKKYRKSKMSAEQIRNEKNRFRTNKAKKYRSIEGVTPSLFIQKYLATGGKINRADAEKLTGYKANDLFGMVSDKGASLHDLMEQFSDETGIEVTDGSAFDNEVSDILQGGMKQVYGNLNNMLQGEQTEMSYEDTFFEEAQTRLENADEVIDYSDMSLDEALTDAQRAELDSMIAESMNERGEIDFAKVAEQLETELNTETNENTNATTNESVSRDSAKTTDVEKTESRTETARAELEAAKKAFSNKLGGSMQMGGLGALPEFVKLVKAYGNLGIATAQDFLKQFRKDFPQEPITDRSLVRAFTEVNKQLEIQGELSDALSKTKKAFTKIRSRLKAVEASKANAADKLAEIKSLRQEIVNTIKNNFPQRSLITSSIAKQIATASTPKQIEKVIERIEQLSKDNIAKAEQAERVNLINRVKDNLNPKTWVRKSKNDKIAKAVIDVQAREEIKDIVDNISTPIDQMTNQELTDLNEMLETAFIEGKIRQTEANKVQEAERKAKSLRLSEAISEKKALAKPVGTIKNAITSLRKGNIVVFQGEIYDKSMLEDFMLAVGVSIPTVTVDGVQYNVREKAEGSYTVQTMNANGDLVPVKKSDPARAEAITEYQSQADALTSNETNAVHIPISKQLNRVSNLKKGIWGGSIAWEDMLYDMSKSEKELNQLKKDLLDPVVRATMNTTEQKYELQKKHLEERKKIFGKQRLRLKKHKLFQKAGIELIDTDGQKVENFTNDEAIYLYNILQRADYNQKFIASKYSQEMADKIFDYVSNNPELKAYADSLIQQYQDYLPQINEALTRNGYPPIENKNVPSKEKLANEYGQEYADKYYERLAKANNGVIPMFEPYSPASVADQEIGMMQNNDLFGDNTNAVSAISNNAIAATKGGELQVKSSEVMFQSWLDGMTNMTNKMDLFKTLMAVFSKPNMSVITNTYGKQYGNHVKQMINSIILGKAANNDTRSEVRNWLNRSAAVTMALNTASAVWQLISLPNFAFENKVFGEYMANFLKPREYLKNKKEVAALSWVKARKKGDLSSVELRELGENQAKLLRKIDTTLSKGYVLSREMDAAAIIKGGTPYYMAMKDRHFKEYSKTMPKDEAMAKAKKEASFQLYKAANDAQQSSEQYQMSAEQRNPGVRFLLTFGNTSMQYTRLMIRAARDIKNRRGNTKENIAKIIYYGAVQNMIFNMFARSFEAIFMGGDDEDESKVKNGLVKSANASVDGALRGLGSYGAVVSLAKNLLYDKIVYDKLKRAKERDGSTDELIEYLVDMGEDGDRLKSLSPGKIAEETFRNFSPNAASKYKSMQRMLKSYESNGLLKSTAHGLEFSLNIPTGRLITITEQVQDAANDQYAVMERGLRLLNILKRYDLDQREKKNKESGMSPTELKKQDPEQWKEFYGPGSDYYEMEQERKAVDKELKKEYEEAMKDLQ